MFLRYFYDLSCPDGVSPVNLKCGDSQPGAVLSPGDMYTHTHTHTHTHISPYVYMCESENLVAKSYPALCDPMNCSPSGKNTGVDCLSLLQGIFPTQGSNTRLQHCRWILYHLKYQGSQEIYYKAITGTIMQAKKPRELANWRLDGVSPNHGVFPFVVQLLSRA